MVRAILEGKKTQTRRIVKPQPWYGGSVPGGPHWAWPPGKDRYTERGISNRLPDFCPFGQVGDRLWVREAWGLGRTSYCRETGNVDDFNFHRGGVPSVLPSGLSKIYRADPGWGDDPEQEYWRPSIHMPRWASRITLEITGVGVERIQSISGIDAQAEGITSVYGQGADCSDFAHLWNEVCGPNSWEANPWVWVIEFRRVE